MNEKRTDTSFRASTADTSLLEPRGATGATTDFARRINRDLILDLVRRHQPMARIDLARASGLQNSTVSSIVDQLLAEGWIREGEAVKTLRGRRPTQISLNHDVAMLAADIHPGRAILAVIDLNGRVLAQQEIHLPADAERGIADLAGALLVLRDRSPHLTFIGLGVCIPGRVQRETGRLILAPNLHWQNFDVRGSLAERLDLQVELENDANACLLSELWFGHLDGVRNAVLLAISEGLGASLLAESHLVVGRLGLAGEFGHICFSPGGPLCGCGRYGCWEMFASSRAALRSYRRTAPDGPAIEYRELARLAETGEPHALAAIETQAHAIGKGLRMVTAAVAPELILFAGDISYSWSIARPILLQECSRSLLAGAVPRLVCTGDGRQAHLLGAAALVLQRHSDFYRSRSADRAANTARSAGTGLSG